MARAGAQPSPLLLLALLLAGRGDGCSFTYVGCHRDGGGTGTAMPCTDCSNDKRLLRFHLSGCPIDQYWSAPPAGTPPAPTCAPAEMNKEYCAEMCASWRPWGTETAFYVGL